MTHFDRFILPSISEVEYRMGEENHLLVATAMTPVSDFETRLWAVVSFRLRVPHAVVKRAIKPLAMQIFQQDARVLKSQTALVKRFGGSSSLRRRLTCWAGTSGACCAPPSGARRCPPTRWRSASSWWCDRYTLVESPRRVAARSSPRRISRSTSSA